MKTRPLFSSVPCCTIRSTTYGTVDPAPPPSEQAASEKGGDRRTGADPDDFVFRVHVVVDRGPRRESLGGLDRRQLLLGLLGCVHDRCRSGSACPLELSSGPLKRTWCTERDG